jgi:cytochrome c oxidase subunit 2
MKRIGPPLIALLLAGCGGVQSSNGHDGVQSSLIGSLFDVFFWTTAAVYVFVLTYLGVALWQGHAHRSGGGLQGEPPFHLEAPWRLALAAFAGVTVLILAGLSIATWLTDSSLARASARPALKIELTGHQWWWDVRYDNPDSSRMARTANELHIPVDATTVIRLQSDDVIHSMWIPNLAGKQDLIPGRHANLVLHPLHTGVFRAQCAEFCGMEHAKMALDVTVDSPGDFHRWYEAQVQPPVPPASGAALTGYALFQTRQCASCHAVAGTPASASVAPDLSHVASRRTIAAGTLPTTHANLVKWIRDPQKPKPGNNMPRVPLTPAELRAVTAYVETLR